MYYRNVYPQKKDLSPSPFLKKIYKQRDENLLRRLQNFDNHNDNNINIINEYNKRQQMGYDRLMKPINLDNEEDEERTMYYNFVKYNEHFSRLFDKSIPQIPRFGPNWKYVAEQNNPNF
jgi:uncharacterized protein YfkK (UPF0435 family)